MKKILVLLLTVLTLLTYATSAMAGSSRVQWEWRDSVTTAHPGFVSVLENGNVLFARNGYLNPAVLEVNSAKEVVWEFGPIQANSAVRLSNGNTLIADSGAPGYPFIPRVIEVDGKNNIVWSYDFKSRAHAPRFADRLPNGNTLIVTPQKVLEVTTAKKEVWSYSQGLVNPVRARRLGNGNTLIVDKGYGGGKVIEVNSKGAIVWQYGDGKGGTALGKLSGPIDVVRHEDGSTTIVDFASARLLELDAANQVVKIISWQDVLRDLPIMNQWGVAGAADGSFYLSASYTNGKPTLLRLDDKSIKTYLNGKWLYTEILPMTVGGSTLIPARDIFTAFGAWMSWDNATKTLTANKDNLQVVLTVDKAEALVNGVPVSMETPPVMRSGTLLVPLRFAAKTFGVELKWDDSTKTINLITGQTTPK
ncbi:stalk domain-containing protein [Zhaonella formicivorans]|uniref:stalk domain-containing protein n=1 Tax=Zhaonella formicivorans TaxID=2528593 RepID=UPI001D117740|nr:stalk domain-containing protein [Zhaonella formicivorans]